MNMEIEGTRHERVMVLVFAYIIGFVTAYIAFGVIQLQDAVDFSQFTNQNASVIASQHTKKADAVFVAIDTEGLIVIKNNERILLSLKNNGELTPQDGVHTSIVLYSLSPDKTKVYFCEEPFENAESCQPYIYSLKTDTVYPVTVKGERVAFKAEGHSVQWTEAGELVIQ